MQKYSSISIKMRKRKGLARQFNA